MFSGIWSQWWKLIQGPGEKWHFPQKENIVRLRGEFPSQSIGVKVVGITHLEWRNQFYPSIIKAK